MPTMSNNKPNAPESFADLPGIGATRETALHAAGFRTRADLARATAEDLRRIAHLQPAYAERVVAALEGERRVYAPPTDEAMPDDSGATHAEDIVEPSAPEQEPTANLDRATLTLQTALADITRRMGEAGDLARPFARVAEIMDKLPERAAELADKQQARIVKAMDRLTAHLEKAAGRKRDLSPKQAATLKDRIKVERLILSDSLDAPKQRKKK